jgi:hypothetical protein
VAKSVSVFGLSQRNEIVAGNSESFRDAKSHSIDEHDHKDEDDSQFRDLGGIRKSAAESANQMIQASRRRDEFILLTTEPRRLTLCILAGLLAD